jgi:hypothetical protein
LPTWANARAPVDKIAAALGIEPEEFRAWASRLVATRVMDANALLYSAPMPPQPPPTPFEKVTVRIRAERVFEAPGEAEGD